MCPFAYVYLVSLLVSSLSSPSSFGVIVLVVKGRSSSNFFFEGTLVARAVMCPEWCNIEKKLVPHNLLHIQFHLDIFPFFAAEYPNRSHTEGLSISPKLLLRLDLARFVGMDVIQSLRIILSSLPLPLPSPSCNQLSCHIIGITSMSLTLLLAMFVYLGVD